MTILYVKTALGEGLPALAPGQPFGAGFDVYAAVNIEAPPASLDHPFVEIPLGFVYRFVEESPIIRNGIEYVPPLEVVKKRSGDWLLDFQAIIFDYGYQHALDDPRGIRLRAVNRSSSIQRIERGRKVTQLVETERRKVDVRKTTLEELAKIRPPDGRGVGHFGSTDRAKWRSAYDGDSYPGRRSDET